MAQIPNAKRVVVVGLGMVGIAFIEKLLKYDARTREYNITVLGEESHLAYNRVGLTSFFEHRKIENLYLNPAEWYTSAPKDALGYLVNTKVVAIDSANKTVTCANGDVVPYDILVLATGSDAILPRHTPGHDAKGVFVYRTIDDLVNLIDFAGTRKDSVGAVVGGGLLGLEAAKAMMDLESFAQVKLIERNKWVLSRQLDEDAGTMVVQQVRDLGLDVKLSKRVKSIKVDGDNSVSGVVFEDGEEMDCSTICFAIGVRARDDLALSSGLECAERGGGIVVGDDLATSQPDIYAIGECASWQGQTFGLIAPGVEMADVLAFNLTQAKLHSPRAFKRPDLSTKLKLLGVDVASFGDFFADRDGPKHLPPKYTRKLKASAGPEAAPETPTVKTLTYKDPFQNVYKKYLFTADGKYLLGGMMIGDTKDYVKVVPMVKNMKELETPPSQLILGAQKEGDDGDDLDDDTQICSCHNVTKGDVVNSVKDGTCKDLASIKSCTKAGTGCGGCMPLVTTIFNKTMAAMGNEVKNHLCAHFSHSRAELYHIVMVKRLTTLRDVMREAGNDAASAGCELCKPAVGSILASLWNRHVMDRPTHGLQDTNDRFLGNIQRDGSYSVVPRVPGGEITPERLVVIGEVAREFGLYTKITGGQRIDMFGARKQDLPAIWGRLVAAGMESGHAYAKSLRTVKSCVGSTWCRFGIGDSVGMAVRLEERYKSVRAPHKIKGGVSGCVRECAEAQSKDFGLIATEKGFNIFVAGNGGAKPRHAELLAKDVLPADVVPILDRYLMFYIRTADKLQRTAPWLESLPGGLKYLQEVVLEDKLGICASLEAQMEELVGSFFDEWAEAIKTPALAAKFRQFHNSDARVDGVEAERERGQSRPVYWAKEAATDDFKGLRGRWSRTDWEPVIEASYFDGADELPNGISANIKRGDTQLAVWRFKGRFYATQQMCPHKRAFVLSDGLLGQSPCDKKDGGKRQDDESLPPTPSSSSSASSASDTSPPTPASLASTLTSLSSSSTTPSSTTTTTTTTSQSQTSPWISCPHHKRNFDLGNGSCSTDTSLSIATFDAEARPDGMLYLRLPPTEELDAALGTSRWMVRKGESGEAPFAELDRRTAAAAAALGKRGRKPNAVKAGPGSAGTKMVKPVELMAGGGGCGSAPEW
ncbi:nitrite reductase [Purpureocillium lilacinum]|uniref:Nitrite reductase [NAD(P)H] n=1 Tax=Purpureocillium lilacinum TaxID=33203 RepID=A0A179GLA5_PURLI|nr:nitrite reductase [Purpureocillium lilacinum]OAQ78667.1 nitrite reductase [Purpureocillium lilacinum]OAQ93589.1 nitrite reductase [Purpureocillium lilacinum]PWI76470.1 nitrite reductase [Purpureocillium lilacinum]